MLQVKPSTPLHLFSIDSLMEIYKKVTFPQRSKIFEIFLPENAELSRTNPPYPSSLFPEMIRQVVSIISCLLSYPNDQWVDEIILGFLSMFSTSEKPSIIFNYNEFLSKAIHDQFLKFSTEGYFKYPSVLLYLFLFHQKDKFRFQLQNLDEQCNPQSIIP